MVNMEAEVVEVEGHADAEDQEVRDNGF